MIARWYLPCLAVIIMATSAPAGDYKGKNEFPLKYRLAFHIRNEIHSPGQSVKLTADKIAFESEPAYQSKTPLYGSVRLGAAQQVFHLVLDQSAGKNHGYDILYIDANRDGRLTTTEKFTAMPGRPEKTFGPVKILVDYGREKCWQWFSFDATEFPNRSKDSSSKANIFLSCVNTGYYLGRVTFGDTKRLIAVSDANGNGMYNDGLTAESSYADWLVIDINGDGELDGVYEGKEGQPLGRYVQVDGRWWLLDVAADGSAVTVEPLNKPLGVLQAKVKTYTLLLRGEEGVLRVQSSNGKVRLPAGKYQLVRCDYQLADKAGKLWQFSARAGSKEVGITVPKDETAALRFGPPLVPKIHNFAGADGQFDLSLELRGAGGEVYNSVRLPDYQMPPVPKVRILDAAGKELDKLDFHYG